MPELAQNKSPEAFAAILASKCAPDVLEKFCASQTYQPFFADPVGFGEKVLGETYTDDVKKMMLSVRDNQITVARSANATGKSHSAARVAIWFALTRKGAQVYTAAAPPEDNLKRILWGEINSIVEKHPGIFSGYGIRTLNIEKSASEFITGVTIPTSGTASQREAKFSGKHAPYLLFILDEGDAIPDEVYQGIESCMSGGIEARLLIMFNPRAQKGAPYRFERDNRANIVELSAFNHPNVITGKNIIPGAVTCDTTVRRIHEWCRPVNQGDEIDLNCFELPDFLIDVTTTLSNNTESRPLKAGNYKIVEQAFAYMVLGRYPAQSTNQLINREWIQAARERWDVYTAEKGDTPPATINPIMGFDIAEGVTDGDNNSVCFRYGGFVSQLHTWGGMDLLETENKGVELYHEKHAKVCVVDGTGVGAGVAPHMLRRKCFSVSLKFASKGTEKTELGEFLIIRDQLWWACREWLRTDGSAMLPPNERMVEQLSTPTYTVQNGKIRVMTKDVMKESLGYSPDEAESLILTFGDTLKVATPPVQVSAEVRAKGKRRARILNV